MDFLQDVDLDWLCLGAELAAGLLILSLAWRPGNRAAKSSALQVAAAMDWEPLQTAHAQAVTGSGRSLALRPNPTDEQRLRDLLHSFPTPSRDRLTGTCNANGMDRLIREWSDEPEMNSYPSCYAMLSLSSAEQLMEQHGAACIEQAVKQISELLTESLGGNASISRYQPHSFLLHHFGKSLEECRESLANICEQIAAPEFFSFHEETVQLGCDASYWYCNRSVEPEELLQLLSEYGDEDVPVTPQGVAQEDSASTEPEEAPEPEKPFSIDALAPFPCPWDSPAEETVEAVATQTAEPDPVSNATQHSVSNPEAVAEESQPETLEGFASTDQIDELLAQLSSVDIPEPVLDEAYQEPPNPPEQDEVDDSPSLFGPEDDPSEESREVSATDSEDDSWSEKPSPVPRIEMPEPATELPSSRSIYTDDIEESLLKDDLASLFAAVRSSAVGDFGYDGNPSSKPGSELPGSKPRSEPNGPQPPS